MIRLHIILCFEIKKKKIVNISKKKAERSPRESRQHFTRWFTCSGASACLNKRALKSSAKTREEEMAAIASVSLLCPSANMGSLTVARHKNNLLRCVLLLEGLAGRVNRPRWALLADGYRPGGGPRWPYLGPGSVLCTSGIW